MNKSYKFIKSKPEDEKPIDTNIYYFYHVAGFKENGTYQVRQYIIYGDEIENVSIKMFYLTKKQLKSVMKDKKLNEYKVFPVFDLSNIPHITTFDIQTLKSSLMYDYQGQSSYCPFE
jgi:hypothetical protein